MDTYGDTYQSSGLYQRLVAHARTKSDAPALCLPDGEGKDNELTWRALRDAVELSGAALAGEGARSGDVVLIVSSSLHDQIFGFLGAVSIGAVPSVLSYPSSRQTTESFTAMLSPVVEESRPKLILCADAFAPAVRKAAAGTRVVLSSGVVDHQNVTFPSQGSQPRPQAPAFLQFSSGTTGARKPVAVTAGMLAAQAESYGATLGLTGDDCVVSWLPLYHDMGLVGCLLLPLFHGVTSVHISPFDWLKEPHLLLDLVTRHRGTIVFLPNFAYLLCAERLGGHDPGALGSRQQYDLSSVRAWINCSEPISASAHQRFLDAFSGAGVHREQLQTCYAMAEATFAVTQSQLGAPLRIDRVDRRTFAEDHYARPAESGAPVASWLEFVSCGSPIAGVDVRIGGAAEDRHTGEIEIRGPGVLTGYERSTEPRADFTSDGWFRTGDLGYLADGELFVTGRAKDLIIHRGHNVYPTDIEESANRVNGCRPGRAVAFGHRNGRTGTDDVILMAELSTSDAVDGLAARLREQVRIDHDLTLADVVVCQPDSLRKSTSGKLSRNANRRLYVERYDAGRRETVRPPLERSDCGPSRLARTLLSIWSEVLATDALGIDDPLVGSHGLDSVTALQGVARIEARLGRRLDPLFVWQNDTVRTQEEALGDEAPQTLDPVLVCVQPGSPSRPPFFLVHAAGGRAWPYTALAGQLSTDVPIYAFQAPGLFDESLSLTIEESALLYAERIIDHSPEGTLALGGWSFGGLVAHELASVLRDRNRTVDKLILFDTDPPAAARKPNSIARSRPSALGRFAASASAEPTLTSVPALFEVARATLQEQHLREGPRRDDLASVWEWLLRGFREVADPDELKPFALPAFSPDEARANARVWLRNRAEASRFVPRHRFHGRLVVFAAENPERLTWWSEHSLQPPEIYPFAIRGGPVMGPHFCMFDQDNIRVFADDLDGLLRTGHVNRPRW